MTKGAFQVWAELLQKRVGQHRVRPRQGACMSCWHYRNGPCAPLLPAARSPGGLAGVPASTRLPRRLPNMPTHAEGAGDCREGGGERGAARAAAVRHAAGLWGERLGAGVRRPPGAQPWDRLGSAGTAGTAALAHRPRPLWPLLAGVCTRTCWACATLTWPCSAPPVSARAAGSAATARACRLSAASCTLPRTSGLREPQDAGRQGATPPVHCVGACPRAGALGSLGDADRFLRSCHSRGEFALLKYVPAPLVTLSGLVAGPDRCAHRAPAPSAGS